MQPTSVLFEYFTFRYVCQVYCLPACILKYNFVQFCERVSRGGINFQLAGVSTGILHSRFIAHACFSQGSVNRLSVSIK